MLAVHFGTVSTYHYWKIVLLPTIWGFAECNISGQSAKPIATAVSKIFHLAKVALPSASLGKVTYLTNLNFAECHSTRQNCHSTKGALPVTVATCSQISPSV
jgi:hypothetical protein